MKTSSCSVIWIAVLLAILVLTLKGQLGLLALALVISLLLACSLSWPKSARQADSGHEKR